MHEAVRGILTRLTRAGVRAASVPLPQRRRRALERRVRGRADARRLREADCVVVSFGKSGRTWLRVMLSRFYQQRFGLSQRSLIGFANLHEKNPVIPKILFTHDNYL